MRYFSRFINPLFAFIAIQLLWVLVVIFWIYWFTGSHRRLRALAEKYSPELLQGGMDWFILTEGLLLLLAILAGVYVIFLYWQRQAALYRAQRQFIAQVTHELKSPLASLQLHLQTIRMRRLPAKRLDTFIDTMLSDTDRLDTLIDNLLSANRLDQRGIKLHLLPANFSEFTAGYFRSRQFSLPKAGTMELEVEADLHANFEAEAMETVFRNLLENAILYGNGPPRIDVSLRRDGKHAHLTFADQGKGLEKKDLKKIFRMFYRVRHPGETIRGSGLGLFIIQAVVRHHRGRIWVESPGLNQGTTFHLRIPLCPPPVMEQP
jgi:two-component system, OmpR family, phosphate regulon sensor histidine kinase PhoR